jgi:uncharacterized protein YutE (UPF0331/DUF86 family)
MIEERLAQARKALAAFRESLGLSLGDPITRDPAILRFVFSFETAWKASRAFLRERHDVDAAYPTDCIRALRNKGALSDEWATAAVAMAKDRNLAVHVYRESLAIGLAQRLTGHLALLEAWLEASSAS